MCKQFKSIYEPNLLISYFINLNVQFRRTWKGQKIARNVDDQEGKKLGNVGKWVHFSLLITLGNFFRITYWVHSYYFRGNVSNYNLLI